MNISQLFVTKRPIAWTAMVAILVWGVYAYTMMPQRQDPIIPVVTGVIVTPYPGAEAEKVEQEVTRKIERKVAENPAVEHVKEGLVAEFGERVEDFFAIVFFFLLVGFLFLGTTAWLLRLGIGPGLGGNFFPHVVENCDLQP